jgi:two-component system cell cycle response regulator DivK
MIARVLVIEDNLANRELLCDWLEAERHEVLAAENLEQGCSAFTSRRPQVVLLDVQLGAEDGLAFAAWVRCQGHLQPVPIIAVTAHAMITDQERVIEAGCNACVSKPIDFAVLRREIEIWLARTS